MGILTSLKIIYIQPDTTQETLDISDRVSYIHLGNEGFGMAPIDRHTEQGPLQHGTTDVGFNFQDRSIQLVLNALTDDYDDYFDTRHEILTWFSPFREEVYLQFTKPDATVYRTRVRLAGGLSLSSEEKQGHRGHRISLQLKADPFFFQLPDPPSTGPREQELTLNDDTSVTGIGNAPAFPIITAVGPLTNLLIINSSTSKVLGFSGTISGGTTVTIDTRYGYKTVKNQLGASVISMLATDSDLADFSIYPNVGDFNTFSVAATGTTGASEVTLEWYDQFLGI